MRPCIITLGLYILGFLFSDCEGLLEVKGSVILARPPSSAAERPSGHREAHLRSRVFTTVHCAEAPLASHRCNRLQQCYHGLLSSAIMLQQCYNASSAVLSCLPPSEELHQHWSPHAWPCCAPKAETRREISETLRLFAAGVSTTAHMAEVITAVRMDVY